MWQLGPGLVSWVCPGSIIYICICLSFHSYSSTILLLLISSLSTNIYLARATPNVLLKSTIFHKFPFNLSHTVSSPHQPVSYIILICSLYVHNSNLDLSFHHPAWFTLAVPYFLWSPLVYSLIYHDLPIFPLICAYLSLQNAFIRRRDFPSFPNNLCDIPSHEPQ